MRILFVCLGNICRSPTAEAVFRKKVEEAGLSAAIQMDSCGTAGYHIGEPPDQRTMQAARQRGFDMSMLRGRQVAAADFDHFDLILAMDHANLRELQRQADAGQQHKIQLFLQYGSGAISEQEVPDPYYGGPAGFERVLDLVEDACDGLLEHVKTAHRKRT